MATSPPFTVTLGSAGAKRLVFKQDGRYDSTGALTSSNAKVIGFSAKKSGNKSTQSALVTLNNEEGNIWTGQLPPRSPAVINIGGDEVFSGFVDNIGIPKGNPGQLVVECVGRTVKLKDSAVRPIIYGSGASGAISAAERDFDYLPVIVASGQIQVPIGFRTSPIYQVNQIRYNNGAETNDIGTTPTEAGAAGTKTTPSVFGQPFGASRNQTLGSQGLSYGTYATPTKFTAQGYIRPSAVGTFQAVFGHTDNTGAQTSWGIILHASGVLRFRILDAAAATHTIDSLAVLTNSAAYHFEATWDGATMQFFINGVLQGSTACPSIANNTTPLRIGSDDSATDGFKGDMDSFHYSPGVVRHTSNFAVPTVPYVADSYTSILSNFDTSAQAQAAGIHNGIILARNVDLTDGVIIVDPKYNGTTAYLAYEVFKSKYTAVDAGTIINELIGRHGVGGVTSAVGTLGVSISFEPGLGSDLYVEIGRIRDILGSAYDFYLDGSDVLQFTQRTTASVKTISGSDCHDAEFSADYAAYANSVTARAGDGVENRVGPFQGYLENQIEGLTPTGIKIDALAQGFKALGNRLKSFSFRAKRQTEEDLIGHEIQYNGKRNAIPHVSPTLMQSLSPDSTNILIDQATANADASVGRYGVKAAGGGVAYFSNAWTSDLSQLTGSSSSTAITGNIYQSVTVADLARNIIGGIAFKTASTAGTIRFDIYSGTGGTAGTLLGSSQTVTLNTLALSDRSYLQDWFSVGFSSPIDVSAQTSISIVAVATAGTPTWTYASGTNPYAGGSANGGGVAASSDFTFQFFTVTSVLSEAFAGVYHHFETGVNNDIVTQTNRTPQYFVSSNYVIGSPAQATWSEVTINVARLMSQAAPAGRNIGLKVSFPATSITTDPILLRARLGVAYENGETVLDDPSGIVVGDLFDTIGVDALPYFNPNTGTQTEDIEVPDAGRLEIGANYWLIVRDGNQASSISYFTAMYSDGATIIDQQEWDSSTLSDILSYTADVSTSTGSSSAVGGNSPTGYVFRNGIANRNVGGSVPDGSSGLLISKDSETSSAQVTTARYVAKNQLSANGILTMLSRNRRNYYFPGKSQGPNIQALKTGEVLIWQFDDADRDFIGAQNAARDKSGNGFHALWAGNSTVADTDPAGKFGAAFSNFGASAASGVVSAATPTGGLPVGHWLQEDITLAFWVKATTVAQVANFVCWLGNDKASQFNFRITFDATGHLIYTQCHGDGTGTETRTTAGVLITAATYAHIMVSMTRGATSVVKVYLNGTLNETFAATTNPADRIYNGGSFQIELGNGAAHPTTLNVDEVRLWPFLAPGDADFLQILNSLVINNPYDSGNALLTFPAEADATDDYTTADAADTVKKNIRFAEYLFPAPFQEDFVVLNLPFNFLANPSGFWDLGSFAQPISTTSAPTSATGGLFGAKWANFDGASNYLQVAANDFLHIGPRFTFNFRMQQDTIGTFQPILHKRGEFELWVRANSSAASDVMVRLFKADGTYDEKTFLGVSVGTGTHDITIAYGPGSQTTNRLSLYVDTVTFGEFGTGQSVAVPALDLTFTAGSPTSNPLMVGCVADNSDGTGRHDFYDGKLDMLLWANVELANRFMFLNAGVGLSNFIKLEYTLRSPQQDQLIALGYSGTSTKLYTDGKYMVSRDNEDSWVQTLDGSATTTAGSLSVALVFDKDGLQCNKRDIAEITRVGAAVERVFDFPSQDADTLCSLAAGYLALLKNGLEKGSVSVDGDLRRNATGALVDVGDVVTINYPQKGQFFKDYGVAAMELVVSDGIYRRIVQLGEEERSIASLFGTSEVGI